MRKFLAALLAVMMLASVLTVAVGAEETTTFDKTDVSDAQGLDLVITEVMTDTTTEIDGYTDYDAYEYIEIYNRGTETVDLSSLCLLAAAHTSTTAETDAWLATHKFTNKINLMSGNVYNDVALKSPSKYASSAWPIQNPSNCDLAPGKFAVIWIWNNNCNTVSTAVYGTPDSNNGLAAKDPEREGVFFPQFRDHYTNNGSLETVADDVLIMVAMGATTICDESGANPNGFNLNNASNYVYALAEKTFDISSEAAILNNGKTNPKLLCMCEWGHNTKAGIPNVSMPGYSTIYVPANEVPYLQNKNNEMTADGGEYQTYTDYVEYGSVTSYKEVAVMTYWENPTPGYMMPYQWIYVVGEDNVPDEAKAYTYDGNEDGRIDLYYEGEERAVNPNWKEEIFNALLAAKVTTGGDANQDEVQREEVVYKDRNELGQLGTNKKTNTAKKGLPTWALILIIVGAVVVVAAVVVVVIIIVKKKNKPVATDDVAAEGEVEIIDETVGAEAPATEEAPAETSGEENKPE